MLKIVCILLLLVSNSLLAQGPKRLMNVAYVGHTKGENAFWDNLVAPMPEVAKQLGINLSVYYADYNNRFSYFDEVTKIVNSDTPPDFLISPFRAASSKPLLNLLEKKQIPFISIVNEIPRSERAKVGLPQANYKFWKAQITSDDTASGEMLAQALRAIALKKTAQRPLKLVALAGGRVMESSLERNDGLQKALAQYNDLYYQQSVFTDWNPGKAYRMCTELYHRHGKADIVWAANDDIAITAAQCLRDLLDDDVNNVTIGGVDATIKGVQAVINEQIDITLGGNQMHGAWALIVAFDIYNQKAQHANSLESPFFIVDKKNAPSLLRLLKGDWHQVNFKAMSKTYNPQLSHYDFNLSHLLVNE
ncbi:MAG: ABC transporter substrate-binding protein [Gammaproteobacteria bacterium]|nr:ABC transporter substrate-binding protein [Gammaproteobacteria bacterium]